jgi:hypothetical protein
MKSLPYILCFVVGFLLAYLYWGYNVKVPVQEPIPAVVNVSPVTATIVPARIDSSFIDRIKKQYGDSLRKVWAMVHPSDTNHQPIIVATNSPVLDSTFKTGVRATIIQDGDTIRTQSKTNVLVRLAYLADLGFYFIDTIGIAPIELSLTPKVNIVREKYTPFFRGLFVEGAVFDEFLKFRDLKNEASIGLTVQSSEFQLDLIPVGYKSYLDKPLVSEIRMRWYFLK